MVDVEPNPDFEKQMAAVVREATQGAVDATARAHHEDGVQDVEGLLARELAARGIEVTDAEWLAEMGENIRSSQVVIVSDESEIGADVDQVVDCDHTWELVEVAADNTGANQVKHCTKCGSVRYEPGQAALGDERPPL